MTNILEVNDLCKTYMVNKRENQVLKDVNFQVKQGEFVSIMGPSGSGKSTLLYNVSGMDKMTSGNVKLDGTELADLSEKEMALLRLHKMGFVFQQINLLKNLGIVDNIVISAYIAKTKKRREINATAVKLMERTGIADLSENEITQASGGQLQRVAICRALINDPEIIFCDEPTGALNSKAAKDVMEILNNINESGTTIILVTHDVKVAAKTTRIFYMIDGKIEGELELGKLSGAASDSAEREKKLSHWLLKMGW